MFSRLIIWRRRRRHDPLIAALLDKLPRPGNSWTQDEQLAWKQAFDCVAQLVYRATDEVLQFDLFKRGSDLGKVP